MERRRGISIPVSIAIVLFVTFLSGVAPAAAGTLKVTSFPSGAEVIVDGVNTAKVTPMNVSLADGDHVVIVRIPGSGWNPDTRTVTIVPGNNDLSVTLLPTATLGPPGPKGDKGDKGDNGTNGTSVTFVDYFSGSQFGCPNGGAIYAAGNPPVSSYVCHGTNGIDGQNGINAWRADGPCFDNVNRYVDCGNGTVTDTVTGLIWLKKGNCLPDNNWAGANQAAAGLKEGDCGLTDGSLEGDWRLPTADEWRAMVARAIALNCAQHAPIGFFGGNALLNDDGIGCHSGGSSFTGVFGEFRYWSSTTSETSPSLAGAQKTYFSPGLFFEPKLLSRSVWPVRDGHR